MRNRLVALLGSLLLALGLTIAVPAPASAGYFNDLYHAANDSGYTAPINIICSDGRSRWLYKGEGSPGKCGFHVERVSVGWGQTVRCFNTLPPYQTLTYYPGHYNHVPSGSSLRCYMQRAL